MPGQDFFRPVFCWPEEARAHVRVQRSCQAHKYRPETRLVQSGILRSQFGETSEALFLTQGYVYDNSAQAEARFKGEDPGYQYSRFANPTVTMFEQRMAEFEGAEAGARDRDRHGRGHARDDGPGQGRRPYRGVEGDLRLLPLRDRGLPAALRRDLDDRRRLRPRRLARGDAAEHQDLLPRNADQSRCSKCSTSPRSPRSRTPPARRWSSTTCSPRRCGRARSNWAPTAWSIPPPSTSTARAAASAASSSARQKFITDNIHTFIRQTGPSMSPFNAWVMLKGLETLRGARARADRHRGQGGGRARQASEGVAADLSGPAGSSAGRDRRKADARRLDARRVRGGRRQEGRVLRSRTRSSSSASPTISATPRA